MEWTSYSPTVRNIISSHFHQCALRSIGTRFKRFFRASNFEFIKVRKFSLTSSFSPVILSSSISKRSSSTFEWSCRSVTLNDPVAETFFEISSTLSASISYLVTKSALPIFNLLANTQTCMSSRRVRSRVIALAAAPCNATCHDRRQVPNFEKYCTLYTL